MIGTGRESLAHDAAGLHRAAVDQSAVTDPLVANYTPAWTEWATTFGVIGILTLAFSLGMRYLPAFKDLSEVADEPHHAPEGELAPAGTD